VPDRVVLDTNVYISGLLWRGKPYQCLLLARSGIVKAVYCDAMLAELAEKLREKFGFSENRIHAVAYDYRRMGERVVVGEPLKVVPDDPDDDKFVECAVAANAAVIVSGDQHLLTLKRYREVEVLTAADCLLRYVR
jgi:putative PIN family toxin of toxin-antitoxin system